MARLQYQALTEPVSQDPGRPDRWLSSTPDPVRTSKFTAAVFAASLFFVPVISDVASTQPAWGHQQSQPQFEVVKKQYTYPSFFYDPKSLVFDITMDRWFVQASEPRRDKARWQYLYPEFTSYNDENIPAIPPEIITMDKWYMEIVQPRGWTYPKATSYRYAYLFWNVNTPPSAEFVIPSYRMNMIFNDTRYDLIFNDRRKSLGEQR